MRTLRRSLVHAAALLVLASLSGPALAEDVAGLDGRQLAERVNARDDGSSMTRTITMEMTDRRGTTKTRVARSYRRRFGDDRKLALFYLDPRSIRDTAFLAFDYDDPERADDQWLYLPAARKSRRISSSDRGDRFLGTDLTYEEVKNETRFALQDYTWERFGDGEADGRPCILVRATPIDDRVARELGYSKVEHCIDPAIWIARRTEFWDRKGQHLKTVELPEIDRIDGIWTPLRVEAANHRTGHSTVFRFDDTDYTTELDPKLFTEQQLRKGVR